MSVVAGVQAWRTRERFTPAMAGLLCTCWGFFLANTFALKRLNPLQVAQPERAYLYAAIPLLALLVVWGVQKLWGWLRVSTVGSVPWTRGPAALI